MLSNRLCPIPNREPLPRAIGDRRVQAHANRVVELTPPSPTEGVVAIRPSLAREGEAALNPMQVLVASASQPLLYKPFDASLSCSRSCSRFVVFENVVRT
jgi:hypothetical protein